MMNITQPSSSLVRAVVPPDTDVKQPWKKGCIVSTEPFIDEKRPGFGVSYEDSVVFSDHELTYATDVKGCPRESTAIFFYHVQSPPTPSRDEFPLLEDLGFHGGRVVPDGKRLAVTNLDIEAMTGIEHFASAGEAKVDNIDIVASKITQTFFNDMAALPATTRILIDGDLDDWAGVTCKDGTPFQKDAGTRTFTSKDIKACIGTPAPGAPSPSPGMPSMPSPDPIEGKITTLVSSFEDFLRTMVKTVRS